LLLSLFVPRLVWAQKDKDKQASIPLDHFYVDRQGPNVFRKVLSKVTLGVSTGFSATTFRHEVPGFGIHQPPNAPPRLFNPASPGDGFSNWFNTVTPSGQIINPADFTVNADTAAIGFRSKSFTIPLKATLHVEFNRFRIGGGVSTEFVNLNDFEPLLYTNDINSFSADFSSFSLTKYFALIGVSVYRYENYLLTIDANLGGYGLGKKFDKAMMDKGMVVNLGAMIERDMSEYVRLFIRPSVEFKRYDITVQEAGKSITHSMNAFYLNVGASYRIPELRRCYNKECKAQINHAHGNREYRSRVHPIYKKQNPHYGENYPTLIKYKGKNKRKLNPY
jgi:hypothetical protein